jgi:hypothetical protein
MKVSKYQDGLEFGTHPNTGFGNTIAPTCGLLMQTDTDGHYSEATDVLLELVTTQSVSLEDV